MQQPAMLIAGLALSAWVAALAILAQWAAHPLETFVFYALATLTLCAIGMIIAARDIVHAAAALLAALLAVSGFYLLLAANYLGMVQLVVYAGGILVVIVFGVMLTARGQTAVRSARRAEFLAGGLAALVLLACIGALLAQPAATTGYAALAADGQTRALQPPAPLDMREIGAALLTRYLAPFELASILLLAVMIGAARLARGAAPPPNPRPSSESERPHG